MRVSKTDMPLVVKSSSEAVSVAGMLQKLDHEEMWMLYLDQGNRVISFRMMTSGGWNATIMDIRQVLREALLLHSPNMIMFHNHPSGNPVPGKADLEMTRKLQAACEIMEISLLDHIIIGDGIYYSFGEETVKPLKVKMQ